MWAISLDLNTVFIVVVVGANRALLGESSFEEDGGVRAKFRVQVEGEFVQGRLHFLKGFFFQTASQMPASKEMEGVHFVPHDKPLEGIASLHPFAKL